MNYGGKKITMSELSFKGKEFVYNHHLSVPFRPLVMDAEKGIGEPTLDGNLIVHGDNLHALKALLPLYAGKVDCNCHCNEKSCGRLKGSDSAHGVPPWPRSSPRPRS